MEIVGYDLDQDGQVEVTSIPLVLKEKDGEPPKAEVYSTKAKSIDEGYAILNTKTSKTISAAKVRITLIGENLAKHNFRQALDLTLREQASPLQSEVAIVKGTAKDFLTKSADKDPEIGKNLPDQVESQERYGIYPKLNIKDMLQRLLDPGQNLILPYAEFQKDKPVITGTAMLHFSTMTGTLSRLESVISMFYSSEKKQIASITLPVLANEKRRKVEPKDNLITIRVNQANEKFKYQIDKQNPQRIKVDMYAKLKVSVREFTDGKLSRKKKVPEIENTLSKELTKQSREVIHKLQLANCDLYGIGRHIAAFHPKVWNKLDWEQTYPHITIVPHVEMKISNTGIVE